jgi:alpha-1,6-mannosyltransferase
MQEVQETASRAHGRPLRLVDATMLWTETSGGVRRYLDAKHAWLARQPGVRHTLVVPGPGAAGDGLRRFAAPVLPFSGGYRFPVRRGPIADLVAAGDPYVTAWAVLDAAQRRGVPAVAYCHGDLEAMARLAGGAPAARLARAYARKVYGEFDAVFAGSASMAGRLRDLGLERVLPQPLGVDVEAFHPSRASPAWRAALGLDAGCRLLVYAGRFAPEKHLGVLAAAVDLLGPPYTLLAIGAGPTPPAGRRVRCLSFIRDPAMLAVALASADAFVHAGDQETFGLSALEALACGTPLVARRAAGLAELVDASVGVAVERGTPQAFAEGIEALFARPVAPLREAARRRAQANGWQPALEGLLRHYRRLAGSAAVRGPALAGAGSLAGSAK